MRLINADKIYPDVMTRHGALAISQGQLAYAETVNAILIPEDATNGDMIKALFPNYRTDEMFDSVRVGYDMSFRREFWNAPYKAESEGK